MTAPKHPGVLKAEEIDRAWRKACDFGPLNATAFRKGARQIEKMVLEKIAAKEKEKAAA